MPGPLAEEQQQRRQRARQGERKHHGAAQRRRLEVYFGRGDEQRDAERDTAGKYAGRNRVADRIAQRAHRHHPDAAEQHERGQQERVVCRPRQRRNRCAIQNTVMNAATAPVR